jgi:hypothetical protein
MPLHKQAIRLLAATLATAGLCSCAAPMMMGGTVGYPYVIDRPMLTLDPPLGMKVWDRPTFLLFLRSIALASGENNKGLPIPTLQIGIAAEDRAIRMHFRDPAYPTFVGWEVGAQIVTADLISDLSPPVIVVRYATPIVSDSSSRIEFGQEHWSKLRASLSQLIERARAKFLK